MLHITTGLASRHESQNQIQSWLVWRAHVN